MSIKQVSSSIAQRLNHITDPEARKQILEMFLAYSEGEHELLDHCLFFYGMKTGAESLRREVAETRRRIQNHVLGILESTDDDKEKLKKIHQYFAR